MCILFVTNTSTLFPLTTFLSCSYPIRVGMSLSLSLCSFSAFMSILYRQTVCTEDSDFLLRYGKISSISASFFTSRTNLRWLFLGELMCHVLPLKIVSCRNVFFLPAFLQCKYSDCEYINKYIYINIYILEVRARLAPHRARAGFQLVSSFIFYYFSVCKFYESSLPCVMEGGWQCCIVPWLFITQMYEKQIIDKK